MEQRLLRERACLEEGATADEQTGRFFTLLKRIWDDINQGELDQIKQYLLIIDNPKFGRANLEKVTTCVHLTRLLQDRDLLGINKLSFIKTLLEKMHRYDLLKEVNNYEQESVNAADAKPTRIKSAPTDASSDSRHLQQSINAKKLEIENENMYESKLSAMLEKLREHIKEQTDIIADSEKKLIRLELEKKQKQENELNYRDEREKIEAKIKQLQKESSNTCDLERSLHDDIDIMSQAERDLQYLISQSKCKKNEMSKRHQDESLKERKCSQTINSLQLELHKLELEINFQCQHRQRPYSNENEYRTQHEPSQSSHKIDPTYNDEIIISAEKNADQSSSFQDNVEEIQGEGTLKCESIVVRGQLTDDFLDVTNDKNSSC